MGYILRIMNAERAPRNKSVRIMCGCKSLGVYIENTSDNTICYICIVKSFALWPYLVD